MDNNDLCYIFMSSLKHPYREHTTKESTSLLMKELDQAASCVLHHQHHHQQSSALDSTAAATPSYTNNHRTLNFNHHPARRWDGLTFGSPKSPENVARTILRALGASNEDRGTPVTTGSVTVAGPSTKSHPLDVRRRSTSSGSISQSLAVHLSNGHHPQQHRQTPHLQSFPRQHQNQSSSLLSRCRRRLHLQLTKINGTAEEKGAHSPPPVDQQRKSRRPISSKRQSVVLATNGDGSHDEHPCSSISASDEGATPSSLPSHNHSHHFVTWPKSLPTPLTGESPSRSFGLGSRDSRRKASCLPGGSNSASGREEHQLIAYNSQLLMVKPTSSNSPAHRSSEGAESPGSESSVDDSFAPPPPPPPSSRLPHPDELRETPILDSDTSQSQQSLPTGANSRHYFHRRDTDGEISIIEPAQVSIEHHPPPVSYSQQQLHRHQENRLTEQVPVTPSVTTTTSTDPEPSPDILQSRPGVVGLAVATASVDTTPGTDTSFQRIHNRMCTSYRLKVPLMKNPVDVCLLPNDDVAIADYDNGLLIVNDSGEVVDHKKTFHEVNACGVACVRGGSCAPAFRIFLLVVRDGVWTINVYRNFDLVEMARCPTDAQIENWALRRLVVCVDTRLHLMASGETKSTIWTYEFDRGEWRVLLTESNGGRKATSGNYNDMSVKFHKSTNDTRIVLCEWKRAQLWTLFLNDKTDTVEEKSIKMKRVKGQEWIIQGPHLAVLDEQADILVYDGSGKLFLFDGDSYRCKKIVADLGRGEVSALAASDGWVYALCRYRRCIEAYMYKENNSETHL